jgi:alpha-beta hydrolase superfamily lysophospholipase
MYHRLGNTLAAVGIDLWALDEIGHGLTDGDRAVIRSIDDLVANGRTLTHLAAEAGPGPLFLAGHSLGGAAAAVTVARDPAPYRGVILSGAPISPLDWINAMIAEGSDTLTLELSDLSADPFYLDELENDPLAFTSADSARSLHSILPPAWAELAGTLGDVTLPVLFVHGREDAVVPVTIPRDWASRLPSARLAEFAGARHDVLNETVHREVAAAIAEFVLTAAATS